MEFIKRYGGTRMSVPDNVPMRPKCPGCGNVMLRLRDEQYGCPICEKEYVGEQLKGLQWVPIRGVR